MPVGWVGATPSLHVLLSALGNGEEAGLSSASGISRANSITRKSMHHQYAHRKKTSRFGILLLLLVIAVCAGGTFYYFNQPYPAIDERAGVSEPENTPSDDRPKDEMNSPAGETSGEAPREVSGGPADNALPEEEPPLVLVREIQPGDTAGKILNEWLSAAEIQVLADVCEETFSLRKLRPGKPYSITLDKGEFTSFVYEIDNTDKLIVTREGPGAFTVCTEPIEYMTMMAAVHGTITSNLFQSVTDTGESAGLAMSLADIFAWEINFIRDIQPGDSFSLIVEKRYRDGEFKGYGKIHAAIFVNKGSEYEGYLFHDPDGRQEYFTSSGDSVKRAFLKAPLSFTRISSTFTNARLHPIHKVWRAHPGIDYAAPTGTPVKAVGNGTVTFVGWGKGAGNYIALRHNNGYETMYLHLSRFDARTKKGATVNQGDVIGYVGSTGDSTGPHLDFRMKKNSVYVNPLTELTPRSDPVAKDDMPEFLQHVALWREYLDGRKDPFYSPPDLTFGKGVAEPELSAHSELSGQANQSDAPAPATQRDETAEPVGQADPAGPTGPVGT